MVSVSELYHLRHTAHLLKLHNLWSDTDHGRLTWEDSDRLEKELDRRFLISLAIWFSKISYDEQIQLCIHSGHPKLIAKLSDPQRTAMKILL